jgi:hypothetical protein
MKKVSIEQNQEKEKHNTPKALQERLMQEKMAANEQIERINASYKRTITLLFEGYATTLSPNKNYALSEDFKTTVET